MADVNNMQILGRVGQDPEMRYLNNGTAVCNLSVATKETWRDKNTGEKKEETEWHRVVIWGKLAEIAGEYAKKGQQVYLQGKLKTRKWQDQSGQDRYSTEIVLQGPQAVFSLVGGSKSSEGGQRQNSGGQQQQQRQPQQQQQRPPADETPMDFSDDIPF